MFRQFIADVIAELDKYHARAQPWSRCNFNLDHGGLLSFVWTSLGLPGGPFPHVALPSRFFLQIRALTFPIFVNWDPALLPPRALRYRGYGACGNRDFANIPMLPPDLSLIPRRPIGLFLRPLCWRIFTCRSWLSHLTILYSIARGSKWKLHEDKRIEEISFGENGINILKYAARSRQKNERDTFRLISYKTFKLFQSPGSTDLRDHRTQVGDIANWSRWIHG